MVIPKGKGPKKSLEEFWRILCTKKLSCPEETLLQTLQGDWSTLGGHPPPPLLRSPLFFYPTWPRCGFSTRLPVFLLDIGHSLGLCPLKNWGPSEAKWSKVSSVLIWRTMAESIHDSRPSIWTSPHNLLRSQIPLSFFFIVFCIFKETKKSQFLSFTIDKIYKSPSMTKLPSTAENRFSRQTKQNCLSRHSKSVSFLKIYMQWKVRKKFWFPFYLWRWISGSPFQIPSRIEILAYQYKNVNARFHFFYSPRRTLTDLGWRKAREEKDGSINLAYPVELVYLSTRCLESLAPS